jgi:hypothetical protein
LFSKQDAKKASDRQFVMHHKAQSGKVRFLVGGILPNETHVATAKRALLREAGMSFSCEDSLFVRNEAVSITLTDSTERHVAVFSAYAPSHFIAANLRTAAKIGTAIDIITS